MAQSSVITLKSFFNIGVYMRSSNVWINKIPSDNGASDPPVWALDSVITNKIVLFQRDLGYTRVSPVLYF